MVLKAYWPLDEDSGDATDYRNGYDASLNGGVTRGVAGPLSGNAFDFNGSDSYLSSSFPSDVNYSGLSVNVWIFPEASGNDTVFMKMNPSDSSQGYVILRTSDDNPDWRVRASGSSSDEGVDFESYPPTGEWSMITGVYRSDTGERELFLNGESQGVSEGSSEELRIDNSNTEIGRDVREDTYFEGRISELRVFSHALTETEINYMYQLRRKGLHVSHTRTL